MPKGQFTVPVARLLKNPGQPLQFETSGKVTGVFVTSSQVPSSGLVQVSGTIESAHPGLMVKAHLEAPWEGECVRCLEGAQGTISSDARELFLEVASDEEDTYLFTGETLDLLDMVRDALVLDLPAVPVCSQECQGLCVTCGANLNLGDCECAMRVGDVRWAALDSLIEGGGSQGD